MGRVYRYFKLLGGHAKVWHTGCIGDKRAVFTAVKVAAARIRKRKRHPLRRVGSSNIGGMLLAMKHRSS